MKGAGTFGQRLGQLIRGQARRNYLDCKVIHQQLHGQTDVVNALRLVNEHNRCVVDHAFEVLQLMARQQRLDVQVVARE